jgi:hypothetical protein
MSYVVNISSEPYWVKYTTLFDVARRFAITKSITTSEWIIYGTQAYNSLVLNQLNWNLVDHAGRAACTDALQFWITRSTWNKFTRLLQPC